jgi:hypothetical protein
MIVGMLVGSAVGASVGEGAIATSVVEIGDVELVTPGVLVSTGYPKGFSGTGFPLLLVMLGLGREDGVGDAGRLSVSFGLQAQRTRMHDTMVTAIRKSFI